MKEDNADSWIKSRIQFDDKHPQPIHQHYLLGKGQQRIYICGQSGCGKTTVLRSIIPLFTKDTTHVILCSCVERNEVHNVIGKWCKAHRIYYEKCTTPIEARKEIEEVVETKPLNKHAVIIFDDFMQLNGRSGTGNEPHNLLVTECINWRRNDNISVVVICQYYSGLSPRSRVSINRRFVFRCENVHALRMISQDVNPLFDGSDTDFNECYRKFVLENPYNYLVLGSSPISVHAVTHDENNKASIIPIISKQQIHKINRVSSGEISAGNDSPETFLLHLASQIADEHNSRKRTAMINRFIAVAEQEHVCDNIVDYILNQTGIDDLFSHE